MCQAWCGIYEMLTKSQVSPVCAINARNKQGILSTEDVLIDENTNYSANKHGGARFGVNTNDTTLQGRIRVFGALGQYILGAPLPIEPTIRIPTIAYGAQAQSYIFSP